MLNKAKKLSTELIRIRRDFHRHPELGFEELRTARVITKTLQEIGGMTIKTGVGRTGVVAEMGNGAGPTIAIRADMDALPILEQTGAEYASTNPGVMHACGHDAHMAIALGVAHLLKDCFAEGLPGKVRFLFQPAEEGADNNASGARLMILDGALDGVDAAIALHVISTRPTGQIGLSEGWFCAAVDTFNAWLTTGGGHGAYPHQATDPIWMLGPVLTALHGIVARRVDPMQPAVMSLGQVHAGTASNVIPHELYLQGTLRSFDPAVREQLLNEVDRALSIVRPLGGDYRLEFTRGYPAGWNDATVNNWLTSVATEFLGDDAITGEVLGMGGEDFAYMCQKLPGAMFILGAAIPDETRREHHTNIFDINEACMPIGVAILAETARRFLAGEFQHIGK
jgi:amidohydrolase